MMVATGYQIYTLQLREARLEVSGGGGGGYWGGGSGANLYYTYTTTTQVMPAGGGGGSSYVDATVSDGSESLSTETEGSIVVVFS